MKFVTAFFLMACASPALAIDSCLVGVWEADGADLAHVMGSQMPSGVRSNTSVAASALKSPTMER
jgi:hypothetical protein